jgi:prepilin-type processing-associated H-X9-DG protein
MSKIERRYPSAPNPPCRRRTDINEPIVYAARSLHPGGVNVVMGDASVRYIADDIDIELWRAMSTINGSESVEQ